MENNERTDDLWPVGIRKRSTQMTISQPTATYFVLSVPLTGPNIWTVFTGPIEWFRPVYTGLVISFFICCVTIQSNKHPLTNKNKNMRSKFLLCVFSEHVLEFLSSIKARNMWNNWQTDCSQEGLFSKQLLNYSLQIVTRFKNRGLLMTYKWIPFFFHFVHLCLSRLV